MMAIETKLRRSELTGKWLVAILRQDQWRTVSAHFRKSDAESARLIVQSEFSKIGVARLEKMSDRQFTRACGSLPYEDDDEPLGILTRSPSGNLVMDCSGQAIGNARAIFSEHDLLSDSAKKNGPWLNTKRRKPRGFG